MTLSYLRMMQLHKLSFSLNRTWASVQCRSGGNYSWWRCSLCLCFIPCRCGCLLSHAAINYQVSTTCYWNWLFYFQMICVIWYCVSFAIHYLVMLIQNLIFKEYFSFQIFLSTCISCRMSSAASIPQLSVFFQESWGWVRKEGCLEHHFTLQ